MELHPFELLRQLRDNSREPQASLTQIKPGLPWKGVGFYSLKQNFVVPVEKMVEVIRKPKLTPVPGVELWLRGLANVKGQLLAVVDLQGFILGQNIDLKQGGQVLVVKTAEHSVGLLVEKVIGIQNFLQDAEAIIESRKDPRLEGVVQRQFSKNMGATWILEITPLVDAINRSHKTKPQGLNR